MILSKYDLNKIADVSIKKNVMIEISKDGQCIRIYPEFDSNKNEEPDYIL
ncbi:hypothetical protein G293_00400 [Candidatus Liberibacter africanus PTSAPSY]|uniref:Uncharacterized protein n=1 Tax=Candidatus Liberibacter africanus PTSAPSY TaxID=1277257 RepID=A0A0G3I5I9_LIBAF|nr:hypothetical protein G293_00400 [Candidatus Liberibacter africanus PTSAPSY]